MYDGVCISGVVVMIVFIGEAFEISSNAIEHFCEFTSASSEEARTFLVQSRGKTGLAVQSFFSTQHNAVAPKCSLVQPGDGAEEAAQHPLVTAKASSPKAFPLVRNNAVFSKKRTRSEENDLAKNEPVQIQPSGGNGKGEKKMRREDRGEQTLTDGAKSSQEAQAEKVLMEMAKTARELPKDKSQLDDGIVGLLASLAWNSKLSAEAQRKHKGWAAKKKSRVQYGTSCVYENTVETPSKKGESGALSRSGSATPKADKARGNVSVSADGEKVPLILPSTQAPKLPLVMDIDGTLLHASRTIVDGGETLFGCFVDQYALYIPSESDADDEFVILKCKSELVEMQAGDGGTC